MMTEKINLRSDKLSKNIIRKLIIIFCVIVLYISFITSNNINEIKISSLNDINRLLVESYSKLSNELVEDAFKSGELLRAEIEKITDFDDLTPDSIEDIIEPALLGMDGIKGIYVLIKQKDDLFNPYWFKEDGEIKSENVDDASSSLYWDPIENSERAYIKPQIYNINDKKVLLTTLIMPIKKNDQVIGTIGLDLSMDFFDMLSQEINSVEGMEISIISYEGTIISHSDSRLIGLSIFDQKKDYLGLSIEEIINNELENINGKHILYTRFNMGDINQQWYLIVSIPKSLLNTFVNDTSIHIILAGLIGLLTIIIFSSIAVKKSLKPIKEVCMVLETAASGDLSVRTSIKSGDEIEMIGKGLNNLLSSLEEEKEALKTEVEINQALNVELEELMKDNDRIYFDTIRSLVNTIEAKDVYTGGHCDRVTEYAVMIGCEVGLSKEEIVNLNYGAILHDIGKIGIPESILCKAGKLTNDEYDLIKQHPRKGYEIVKDIHFLRNSLDIILHHHERFDGRGYPDQLLGNDISLSCRIVAITDAYDAMTSSRSYRSALTKEEAMNELIKNKSTQFDPELVDIFISLLNAKR